MLSDGRVKALTMTSDYIRLILDGSRWVKGLPKCMAHVLVVVLAFRIPIVKCSS